MGEQSSPSSKNCFSSVTAIPPVHSSVAYPSACVHGEKGVKWGKNAKGRKRHVYRRSAYPLQILPATSKELEPEPLDAWARRKGIGLVGTGDFTHPAWRAELRDKLAEAEEGLYTLKGAGRTRPGS